MAVEVTVPALGESIVEATVGHWLKQPGDQVAAGDALVELETDKVNMEVVAPDSGTLQSIARAEGDTVEIGDVLATIDTAAPSRPAPPSAEAAPAPVAEPTETAPSSNGESGRSTPLARRIAAEHGLDIAQIPGTGPSGRVTREDVAAYVQQREGHPEGARTPAAVSTPASPAPAPAKTPAPTPPAPQPVEGGRREERVRMSRRRQTIARRLVEAQQSAAMLTTFNEVDMGAIMDIRKRRRDEFKEKYGVGLGFMSFFTKAVVGALKEFPLLNAEIQGDEMIVKYYYDIGIAVGTEEGLVVPVIRDAGRKTFAEIERELSDLAARARSGQLTLAELQGGTFTISNGGIYGSLFSTPILNAPQVGILGMHRIDQRPVVRDGEIVVRPMMYLALSYDHRIVDGSEAVRFLVRIKEMVEDPELLLLQG